MYKDLNILVLGFARSGYDAAKLLIKHNNKVTINDFSKKEGNNQEHIKELEKMGVQFIFGGHPDNLLDNNYDLIVKNPGINDKNPVIMKAMDKNIEVTTEVDVAFTFFEKSAKIIAVTGSNGKTTTVEIIYQSLKKYTDNVILAGNIGIATSGVVDKINKDSIVVMEISAQQLNNIKHFKPNIVVFTNLSEAHLDFFNTYDNYKDVKLKIFNNNDDKSISIINYDDKEVLRRVKDIKGEIKYFSAKEKLDAYYLNNYLYVSNKHIIDTNDILIKGEHNYLNILSTLLVFDALNIDKKYVYEFLKEFKGYPHRLEYVDNINTRVFYNDSKSTNMTALKTALNTFDTSTILIIGGEERDQNFDDVLNDLEHVKHIVLFGEVRQRAYNYFKDQNFKVEKFELLKDAVKYSCEISDNNDVILFSPGSGSWDYYKDFEQRGEDFKNIVKEIKDEN